MFIAFVLTSLSIKSLQSFLNISHLSLKFYDKIVYFATNIKIRKNVILGCKNRKKKFTFSNVNFIFLLSLPLSSKFFLSFKNDHYSLEGNLFLVQLLRFERNNP